MLAAQATVENYGILSADLAFDSLDASRIW
jgi:hypothetical protein